MKKPILILYLLLQGILLVSCGVNSGNKIPAIDLIPVKSGDYWGYINTKGQFVINPQFRNALVFNDGIALVQSSGEHPLWGYINKKGKYIIAPKYKIATSFSEGLAWVEEEDNTATMAIDNKGDVKFTLPDHGVGHSVFHEGLASFIVFPDGPTSYGFVNKQGQVVIKPQFSGARHFSEGKCAVANDEGKWGFINKEGKLIINYQYDNALKVGFKNNKYVVATGGKYGVIDTSGRFVINPQYEDLRPDGDNFMVEQDSKWGWVDGNGKTIINPQFSDARPFSNSKLAPVKIGSQWGYINKQGTIVINPQFDWVLPFNNSIAAVSLGNGKGGFINEEGKFEVNPQFDDISIDYIIKVVYGFSADLSIYYFQHEDE